MVPEAYPPVVTVTGGHETVMWEWVPQFVGGNQYKLYHKSLGGFLSGKNGTMNRHNGFFFLLFS